MTSPLDQSILELLQASRDDEETIALPVNDRSFGFHAQQAVEKLLKVLIAGHERKYEYTHDLGGLIRHAQALGEELPAPSFRLETLTAYAGVWRYQEPAAINGPEREDIRADIAKLRAFVVNRLSVLRSEADWSSFL